MTNIVPIVKINPDDVQQALRLWNKSSAAGSPLSSMLLYKRKLREMGGNIRQATNEVLFDGLRAMAEKYGKYEDLLRKRYIDGVFVRHIANQMNTSESFVYNMQKDAVRILAEELEMQENKIIFKRVALLDKRLPLPTYQNLVGMDASLDTLRDVLDTQGPPWIVCVVGMGGIGKTSLTDALLRHTFPIGPFEQVGWVSAKQDYYHLAGKIKAMRAEQPAMTVDQLVNELLIQLKGVQEGTLSSRDALLMLEEELKKEPHLIVIDNLETVVDLQNLLPTLRRLSNPTRFVLTSRERLHGEPDVYHFLVPELSFESTMALIRQEANWRNVIHLKPATDQELRPIYDTVGGNPLAIYLIIGLTHIHRLDMILADLRKARSKKIKNLYTYIYRRAWDTLHDLARDIFVQTALIPPSGNDLDFLLYITGLPLDELSEVLDLLGHLNLVQVTGKLGKRVYSLHGLTRTFLLEEVLNWKNES